MEPNEIYEKWKQRGKDVEINPHFSANVMQDIHKLKKREKSGKLRELLSDINFLPSLVARVGFAIGLTALGIFRIFYVPMNLLIP